MWGKRCRRPASARLPLKVCIVCLCEEASANGFLGILTEYRRCIFTTILLFYALFPTNGREANQLLDFLPFFTALCVACRVVFMKAGSAASLSFALQ